jgi:poly(3-hydroxybutyrate) depolymerase
VQEISVEGTARSYIVSLPEGYDASTPYPLVFAYHGLGGSAQLVSGPFYFGLEQVEAAPMIFVYPDGLAVQSGDGAGWDNQGGRDVDFFDALLENLGANACVDENRVFVTGHSYGGVMTHTLACERASVLRAVAPVAGAHFGGGACDGPVAAWGTHGTNDPTVDYEAGLSAIERLLSSNGCDEASATPTAPTDYCQTYSCDPGVPVVWCPHQQEHDWPDFASAAILDFFQQF